MGFRLALLLFASLIPGCLPDRLSGTEVGNPEITVSARVGFVGADTSALISSMEMKVMKMEYRTPGDSLGMFWVYPEGMGMDLASTKSAGNLPEVKMAKADWRSAALSLAAHRGDSSLPDSVSFSAFTNPKFIKLVKRMDGDSVRFLFEIPESLNLRLRFDAERLLAWKQGKALAIEILFDCSRWTSVIASRTYSIRMDGEGRPYAVISPGENAEIHSALLSLFPDCFVADGAEIL